MAPKRSTIGDVAAVAGVSIATVSRVLNDGSSSEATRQKVLAAVELLGYTPDIRGKNLAQGRSQRVGVLISHLTESYVVGIVDSILQTLTTLGYDLMICSSRGREGYEAKYVRELSNGKVDALITVSSDQLRYLLPLNSSSVPHVILTGDAGGSISAMTSVIRTEDKEGMTSAVMHLRSLGHERIAHITGDLRQIAAHTRLATFQEVMAAEGCDTRGLIVEGDFLGPSGRAGAEKLLDRDDPPTAIITASDSQMVGVLDVVRKRGINVPGELSLVGFDNITEMGLSEPRISTVAQPLDKVGKLAAEEVHSRLTTDAPARTITIPMELIVRESTGPMPT